MKTLRTLTLALAAVARRTGRTLCKAVTAYLKASKPGEMMLYHK
jgi:hypothetical protein